MTDRILNIKSDIDLSTFQVIFDGSTMYETPGLYGISHLCEHLICKGFEYLQNDFQRYGLTWNAYTSDTEVVFHITGLEEYVVKYRDEFLNGILSYEITDEDLQKEKNIVMEEYKDAFNDQTSGHYLNIRRKYFNEYGPIGLRSDIENCDIESIKNYIDSYYKKPTRIINVSKNSNFSSDIEFRDIEEFDAVVANESEKLHYIVSDLDADVPEGFVPLELINDFKNKSSMIFTSKVVKDDFSIVSFVCEMLGSGLNSPLYQEIREKAGLTYHVSCFNDKLNNNSSLITIISDTSNKNVDLLESKVATVLENYKEYLTQERFDIVKDNNIVKIKKGNILPHTTVRKYIAPEKWNMENIIYDITLEDVYDIMEKYFKWENFQKSSYNKEF